MSSEIVSVSGMVITVDEDDYERLLKYRWHTRKSRHTFYATHMVGRANIPMSREILGLIKGDPRVADHINGNGLDNRKCNLRICTVQQNLCNHQHPQRNKHGYKGISKHGNRWSATVVTKGKRKMVGMAATREEAARLYDIAARELHGEFATLNFPDAQPEAQEKK